jgi:hypothetical protein
VAGKADVFLKVSMGLALLIGAGCVGYYYAVYLPARDAQLDSERRLEKARAEFARRTAEERAEAEKQAAEERQAVGRAAAQANYEACIGRAEATYDANWAANCKGLADKSRKNRAACTQTPATCDLIYPARDASPNCSLPIDLARSLKADVSREKDRCLQQSQAGLQ